MVRALVKKGIFFIESSCYVLVKNKRSRNFQLEKATAEHLLEIINGGKSSYENLVLACAACNSSRSNKDQAKFAKRQKEAVAREFNLEII